MYWVMSHSKSMLLTIFVSAFSEPSTQSAIERKFYTAGKQAEAWHTSDIMLG
jgi:hypothetical protein